MRNRYESSVLCLGSVFSSHRLDSDTVEYLVVQERQLQCAVGAISMVIFTGLVIVVGFVDLYLLVRADWLFLLTGASIVVNSLHTSLLSRWEKLNTSFFMSRDEMNHPSTKLSN